MNIYYDSEFTGLKTNPSFISIGLVADDGSEFYAEFDDYKNPSKWVLNNVIPNLTNVSYMTLYGDETIYLSNDREDILNSLYIWLLQWETIHIIVDTGMIDWLLFLDLFNWSLPDNVFYMPIDISTLLYSINVDQDITRTIFVNADEALIKHNALNDAKVIKLCYEKIMDIITNGEI